ncbi:hypothetical protein J6590_077205 [Homalodisca vitripennis]|nr:hypothetical protein J6590_077205 [Homalodisca vitripennis]
MGAQHARPMSRGLIMPLRGVGGSTRSSDVSVAQHAHAGCRWLNTPVRGVGGSTRSCGVSVAELPVAVGQSLTLYLTIFLLQF